MLTHDIDRVNSYHFFEVTQKYKELIGLSSTLYSKKKLSKLALHDTFCMLNPFRIGNPFWNFDFLRDIEHKLNIQSVFFFLERDKMHRDSRYSFRNKKVKKLIRRLSDEGCEIGLHGTIASATNENKLKKTLKNLQTVTPTTLAGIRQHILKYNLPDTSILQEVAGLRYNATLGFAEHEGFRNSFCLPFHLFDFKNEKMLKIWELPLNLMDGTVFSYRKMGFNEIIKSTNKLLMETLKFNGIFTLLWHNCHFNEDYFPGITSFYLSYLELIINSGAKSILGRDVILKLESY